MDLCEDLPVKFITAVAHQSCTDKVELPLSFVARYGESIPEVVSLVLRNGIEITVYYRKDVGVFAGMGEVFKLFDCRNGCILAFEYYGGDIFWLHVFTTGYELFADVPDVSGCKLVCILVSTEYQLGKLSLPPTFFEKFGESIPSEVKYCLKDGRRIRGYVDKNRMLLCGLEDVVRLTSMSLLDIVLFTYYGDGVFDLSVFSGKGVEKPILDEQLVIGNVNNLLEITVHRSHMLRHSYGVHVPVRFHRVMETLNCGDVIEVYHESRCWNIEIRKRDRHVELHHGWVEFRTAVGLQVGDRCVFRRGVSASVFEVEIIRAV